MNDGPKAVRASDVNAKVVSEKVTSIGHASTVVSAAWKWRDSISCTTCTVAFDPNWIVPLTLNLISKSCKFIGNSEVRIWHQPPLVLATALVLHRKTMSIPTLHG
eukprot:scaffold109747_cov16-Tisochrysis_lutea.AAC.1